MRKRIVNTSTAALAMLAAIYLLKLHAEDDKSDPRSPGVTTNWLGYVVAGRQDSIDAIGQVPYPQCAQQFQLGLRSDGVVVWRLAK